MHWRLENWLRAAEYRLHDEPAWQFVLAAVVALLGTLVFAGIAWVTR